MACESQEYISNVYIFYETWIYFVVMRFGNFDIIGLMRYEI